MQAAAAVARQSPSSHHHPHHRVLIPIRQRDNATTNGRPASVIVAWRGAQILDVAEWYVNEELSD